MMEWEIREGSQREKRMIERDIKLNSILIREHERQESENNFIASENFASDAVRYFCGSEFTNKYAEGYPGKRYYNGCEQYDLSLIHI